MDEVYRLRAALRDLVALSAIPSAWVGRRPPAIAAGLADVLTGSLYLDFVFVRLLDPGGVVAAEVTRGDDWKDFPAWLERHVSESGPHVSKVLVPNVADAGEPCRGLVVPIGVNADGGLVGVACRRRDFPSETDQLLISVAANHAAAVFLTARLIHERQRAEDALREARAEEALRNVRSQLALVARRATMAAMSTGLAHELNQPLWAVVANATVGLDCLTKTTPPDVREAVDAFKEIAANAHRASGIIQSLRAMVNAVDLPESVVNVNELIRETMALVRGEVVAAQVVTDLDLASDVPAICARRIQLQQVLLNLLNNAVEAMRNVTDRPRALRVESRLSADNTVEIAVADSGAGIGPENITRIFDPFFTTKPDGMGMGLAICRALVDAHGGELSASTARPHGSIFRITLPNRSVLTTPL